MWLAPNVKVVILAGGDVLAGRQHVLDTGFTVTPAGCAGDVPVVGEPAERQPAGQAATAVSAQGDWRTKRDLRRSPATGCATA